MPSAQGPREGIAAQVVQRQPPKYWGLPSGTEHLSRTASRRGGKRYERGNLKSRIACRRPPYSTRGERGAHGGKSKVSPRAPCAWRSKKSKAHSHRLAEHFAQCRYCGQGNTDLYGLVRTCTDDGHRAMWGLCAPEIQKHIAAGAVGRQSTLRNAQGGSKECRTCRTCRTGRTIGTRCERAMCFKNSGAHGTHSAKCHVRISPCSSVFVRIPLPAVSALHIVPCQSSGGSRARQGDSRQSPRPMFGRSGTFAAPARSIGIAHGTLFVFTSAASGGTSNFRHLLSWEDPR